MTDISSIRNCIKLEVEKWGRNRCSLYVRNDLIKLTYKEISTLRNDLKKKSFIRLHYLKMKRDYMYLKIYHDNVKKTLSNEKLLKYFEYVLLAHGFDVTKL